MPVPPDPSARAVDARTFRDALGRFVTGVTVVTMERDEGPDGITVNAFLSLSLDPPLVGVAIDRRAGAHDTLMGSTDYGVSVLAEDASVASDHFAGLAPSARIEYQRLAGVPVLAGALVRLACRIVQRVPVGDHTLFVGEVREATVRDGAPLVYFRGRYGLPGPGSGGAPSGGDG